MRVLDHKLTFNQKYYQKVLQLLHLGGGDARLIGGCVRDALLGKFNKDIDIATTLLPSAVIDILSQNNIKVVPTGIKFGTVTAFIEDEKFEITTLRKDIECYGRYAKVEYTDNYEEDALRRDFTINALSYSLDQKVYDYFGGIEDLKNRKVIFVGNPADRIKEDYLRILRFFRFSAYYADTLDSDALEASIQLKSGLELLSKERIKLEMDKLIVSEYSAKILLQMYQAQILQAIFPIMEFWDSNALSVARSFAKSLDIDLSYLAIYSVMFYKTNITLNTLLKLKFSRQESKIIVNILSFIDHFTSADQNHFILTKLWLNQLNYTDYISVAVGLDKLSVYIARDLICNYKTKPRPMFPLTGHDLLSIGLKGQVVGEKLEVLRDQWIASDFVLTKEHLLQLI